METTLFGAVSFCLPLVFLEYILCVHQDESHAFRMYLKMNHAPGHAIEVVLRLLSLYLSLSVCVFVRACVYVWVVCVDSDIEKQNGKHPHCSRLFFSLSSLSMGAMSLEYGPHMDPTRTPHDPTPRVIRVIRVIRMIRIY